MPAVAVVRRRAAGSGPEPPLQGLELSAWEYRRLPGRELTDGTLALASEVLGLELRLTRRGLRLHDPETGRELPNLAETDAGVERERPARQRAEQAQQRAQTVAAGGRESPRARSGRPPPRSRRPPRSGSAGSGTGGINISAHCRGQHTKCSIAEIAMTGSSGFIAQSGPAPNARVVSAVARGLNWILCQPAWNSAQTTSGVPSTTGGASGRPDP